MSKVLRWIALAFLMAVTTRPAAAFTQTNVLQSISVTLSIYQQGAVNSTGKKLPDIVTSYATKNLIAGLQAATGVNFGSGAKLVQSTVYQNQVIEIGSPTYTNAASTNLVIATNNSYLNVGGANLYGIYGNLGVIVISNNTFVSNYAGNLTTNVVSNIGAPTTNSFTIATNGLTILTPMTNDSGAVTNVNIFTEQVLANAPTTNLLENTGTTVDVLYGGASNFLYDVTRYVSFSPLATEIVVESGSGLETTNPVVTAENGFTLEGLEINYYTTNSPTNLTLTLEGFVKETLKIDTLSGHGAKAVNADIAGATQTWTAVGSGYSGGTLTTNSVNTIQILNGFVTNAAPVVVNGSVSISFLKNLPQ